MTKDNTAWMQCYSTEHRPNMSYVSADGNYGGDEILVFPSDLLTEKHWEVVRTLHPSDRLAFIQTVINGDDATDWEV